MSQKIIISEALLQHIKESGEKMHHGRIIIEVNIDKPEKVDVITESRERFSAK